MTEAEKQKLLATEVGLQVIKRLTPQAVSYEQEQRFHWPRCLHCRRRPTMMVRDGVWLRFKTGLVVEYHASVLGHPEFIDVPRYEILPCCSANYVKTVEGPTKRQRRQAAEQLKERTDGG